MRWLLDLAYLTVALIASPVWLYRMIRTGKIRTDWPGRFGRVRPIPTPTAPGRRRLLFHAVSVGEVNAIRLLVDRLAGSADAPEIVIAATTDTGIARARALYAKRHAVVRYPFDLSFSIDRFLKAMRPDAVALVELEVWPNFTAACARRGIALCVVNGRLTERSARRYARIRPLIEPSFRRLAFAAIQNDAYAARFRSLGIAVDRVHVTGTMKWDTAQIADSVPGADGLAESLGIDRNRPLIVAGSTAPDEHELLVAAVPEGVQLLCAPRRPEWFDQAAAAMPGCARRSRGERGSKTGRFLLDTIGELRAAYALADLVVIGRSFGNLHGSDMMEPIALGKASIVGPAVSDFQDTVESLLRGEGLIQIDAQALTATLRELLNDPARRRRLADKGRRVILDHQGATNRNADLILDLLHRTAAR